MEEDIIKPELHPKPGNQAFGPSGSLIAAMGATLMIFCMTISLMVATVWAFSKLLGLPDVVMYLVMALGLVPVIWSTIWTAGRAWHVERLLSSAKDVDVPVFRLAHYFRR